MGTRGLMGFLSNGEVKATYNHFDSYPDALGKTMLDFIATIDLALTKKMIDVLCLVLEDETPTEKEIENLSPYYENVSTGEKTEWYALLRGLQGKPHETLQVGIMIDSKDFAADSLFCEYGYIANFDDDCLECYEGFVNEKHNLGRFANLPKESDSKYWPIKLVGTIPFQEITKDKNKAFKKMKSFYKED